MKGLAQNADSILPLYGFANMSGKVAYNTFDLPTYLYIYRKFFWSKKSVKRQSIQG